MKNREALEAYEAIKSKMDKTEIFFRLEALSKYLNSLCTTISPKGFKSPFLFQWTYTTEINGEKEYECYLKANLFTATKSLERAIKKLEPENLTAVKERILLDFICDLSKFIAYFDKDHDFSWLLINTNSHISNFYYDLAYHSFWEGQSGEHQEEKLAQSSSAAFIIRQSIEYKIKRVLGIDKILMNKKPYIRTTELCFKAIDKNLKFYTLKDFSFSTIKNIFSWTHVFIHGGYRPEPWQTETALTYLRSFFYSDETSKSKSHSYYGGIEVQEADLVKLKELTEETIKAEGEFEIKWLFKPEVAIIKK